MNKNLNLTVLPEPYWLQEAYACMNYVYVLDSEEWLNKPGNWNRRRKEEFLAPYRSYREAMKARLQPVLEQYPLLAGYVDATPRERESLRSYEPPMMSFLLQMQYILEAEELPDGEQLEEELNRAFQKILGSDLQKSSDVQETEIRGLPDVMAALEEWDGTDADKFRLLRLYSERLEVVEQLWSLKTACREIGWECLALLQERFDDGMEKIRDPEAVVKLLEAVGLMWRENCSGRITPYVMRYDQIVVRMEEYTMQLHIGIEAFHIQQSKEAALYNDDSLLARLKALSDPTRLKILHLLVERPWYLQEMAKELTLTPATVLHHLGVLVTEELIGIQMTGDKKRAYYQVKQQGLEEVSRGIGQLGMTKAQRETLLRQQLQQEQTKGGRQWIIT